jgi:RND family efflux transporter MFP subunit
MMFALKTGASKASVFRAGSRPLMAVGLTTALLLGLGVSGCSGKKKEAAAPPAHVSVVNYAVVSPATAPVQITGSGSVSAWQEVIVGAETGGLTAVSLLVDEGQTVKQGQPLLKMNDVLLQAEFKQAQASYNQANKAYQRAQTLFQQGYLSAAGLDTSEESKLTTEAAMETAQTQLNMATVRAPVSGIVTSRKAVLGQNISQGAELFRIVRDGRIELNMEVVENDLHDIQPGMAAVVTSESTGAVSGSVRIVTPQVDAATRLGYARVSVPWTSGLRPGMFASGVIDAGIRDVLVIPQKAIVYNQNTPSVFVIGSNNKVSVRKIMTAGPVGKDDVVVREGLQANERVVTTGAGFLNEGDLVKAEPSAAQKGTE